MTQTTYAVIIKTTVGWTTHSTHKKRGLAQDQADMVCGNVVPLDEAGNPADVTHCPACGGDPMLCECETPWSV